MTLSYEQDIRPLFRERDRESMKRRFDLWSLEDVRANAAPILNVLQQGRMPCDGAWPQDKIDTLRQWIDAGMAP
jgi:hypothetical protein